jgi:hypothetical protein
MVAVPAIITIVIATATVSAGMARAAMTNTLRMTYRGRMNDRRAIEVFVVAADVVMFFPRMMNFESGRITSFTPGVRRVSIGWIIRIAVIVSRRAIAAAVSTTIKASAENAGADGHQDERLN